jgi:hypothetical protein|tara:strand:+ start:421 stop:567 length:147 start_codon:yes stop_codon:yes gene_type:complete
MDSLKVSGSSFASMGAIMWDAIPWALMVMIGVLQVVYLTYKIKKIKES